MENLESIHPIGAALAAARASRTGEAESRLHSSDRTEVARSFEELLAGLLVKELRTTSGVKLFGESSGSQVFEGLFDRYLAETIGAAGGLGVGASFADQLLRAAGVASSAGEEVEP